MDDTSRLIGRVTRCSTRGFVGALRLPEPDLPTFGSLCKSEAQSGASHVIGVIYDISIEDDPFARQIAIASHPPEEQLADQRANRQVPVEFSALAVGFQEGEAFRQALPPQPPLTMAPIFTLSKEEIMRFSESLAFVRLLLSTPEVPIDDLLGAVLHQAAQARPPAERTAYLQRAGAELARALSHDLSRLESLLRELST